MRCLAATLALVLPVASMASPGRWLDQTLPLLQQEAAVPGVAVAHVDVTSRTPPVVRGYGLADIARRIPVRGDTVFRIGSNSKTFTATAVLVMVESTSVTLETDLRPWLDGLQFEPPLNQPLTFQHLLTHMGGLNERLFGQHTGSENWRPLDAWLESVTTHRFVAPGEVIAYVDHNTNVAGYALQQMSGTPFADYVEAAVLQPLGMQDSTFRQLALSASMRDRMALSYAATPRGPEPYRPDTVLGTPGAGMFTTPDDMALYLSGMLRAPSDAGNDPLSAAFRAQLREGTRQHPVMPGRGLGFAERIVNGRRVLWKDGQASGFNARLLVAPDVGMGFFIVNNATALRPGGGFTPAHRMIRDFTDRWLAEFIEPLPTGNDAIPLPQRRGETRPLEHFEGSYRTTVVDRHSWEKLISFGDVVRVAAAGDSLEMSGTNWSPWGDGLFVSAADPVRRRVFKGDGDAATYLLIDGASYERIPLRETPRFVAASAVVFVFALLAGITVAVRRGSAKVIIVPAAVDLLFIVGSAVVLLWTDPQVFFHGAPLALRLLSLLPWVSAACAVVTLFYSLRRRRAMMASGLVALGSFGVLWLAIDWRLAFALVAP